MLLPPAATLLSIISGVLHNAALAALGPLSRQEGDDFGLLLVGLYVWGLAVVVVLIAVGHAAAGVTPFAADRGRISPSKGVTQIGVPATAVRAERKREGDDPVVGE